MKLIKKKKKVKKKSWEHRPWVIRKCLRGCIWGNVSTRAATGYCWFEQRVNWLLGDAYTLGATGLRPSHSSNNTLSTHTHIHTRWVALSATLLVLVHYCIVLVVTFILLRKTWRAKNSLIDWIHYQLPLWILPIRRLINSGLSRPVSAPLTKG